MLLKERNAFFDTRVTGRSEVWAALRLICELIERRQLGEAQVVLDAAGCTCPSGDAWGPKGGIYDEFGEKYVVPSWIVGEPIGVVETAGDMSSETTVHEGASAAKDKGKGRLIVEEEREGDLKVRVRLSHTARDIMVRTREEENVELFVRRIVKVADVCLLPSD